MRSEQRFCAIVSRTALEQNQRTEIISVFIVTVLSFGVKVKTADRIKTGYVGQAG